MAKQERNNIKQLQSKGIVVAKAKGKHLGRPAVQLPEAWNKLYTEWKAVKITAVAFMNEVAMKKGIFL